METLGNRELLASIVSSTPPDDAHTHDYVEMEMVADQLDFSQDGRIIAAENYDSAHETTAYDEYFDALQDALKDEIFPP